MGLKEIIDKARRGCGLPNTADERAVRSLFASLCNEHERESAWHGLERFFRIHLEGCVRVKQWRPWPLPDPSYAELFAAWAAECPSVRPLLVLHEGALDLNPTASKYAKRQFLLVADKYLSATVDMIGDPPFRRRKSRRNEDADPSADSLENEATPTAVATPDFPTSTTHFSTLEAELLYFMIWGPVTLGGHVWSYMSSNRAGAPSYEALAAFVAKATAAGIIEVYGKHFQMRTEWYRAIHANDDSGEDEIHTMISFSEWFVQQELELTEPAYSLTREAYDDLMNVIRSATQRRFGF